MCDREIRSNASCEPVANEHKEEANPTPEPGSSLRVAPQAFRISAGLKVAGTYGFVRLMQQETVGADGLVAVMFENDRLASKARKKKRR